MMTAMMNWREMQRPACLSCPRASSIQSRFLWYSKCWMKWVSANRRGGPMSPRWSVQLSSILFIFINMVISNILVLFGGKFLAEGTTCCTCSDCREQFMACTLFCPYLSTNNGVLQPVYNAEQWRVSPKCASTCHQATGGWAARGISYSMLLMLVNTQ